MSSPDLHRLKLIVNPIAGTRSKTGLADAIEKRLGEMGFEIDTELTTGRGDATRIAQQAVASGYDGVLACGGDGTVNETARAMCDTGVPMGIIPAGSGNGLARHITIPIDPMMSLEIIGERHIEDCDYVTVNGQPFFCTFGMGFDAAVSDRFAASGQRGKATYVKSAFAEFIHYNTNLYRFNLDGEIFEREAFLVTCCNASQYGNNAYIAPHASITDGLLDIIIIKKASQFRTFLLGFDLMSGLISDNSLIETYRVRHAVIDRANPGPAHLDGEPFKIGTHLDLAIHPGALRLFTSPDKAPFKPILTPAEALIQDFSISFSHFFK